MPQYNAGDTVKFICEGCSFDLHSPTEISVLSQRIAHEIGMTPLAGPFMGEVVGEGDNDGVSVVLIIKESHIAIHAYPFYKAVRIVVDSCKSFDIYHLEKFFWKHLRPSKIHIT